MPIIPLKSTGNRLFWAAFFWLFSTNFSLAHEYWVEPKAYQLDRGEAIVANLKNGVDFGGTSFPYIGSNVVTFELNTGRGKSPIFGRDGDQPALSLKTKADGLHSVSYFNTASSITFQKYEKFAKYFKAEGAENLLARHEELGLPKEDIREVYSRCAKTLVQVGPAYAEDLDSHTGMPAELVALQNPYALKPGEPLDIKMIWMDKPYADIQVRLFEKLGEDAEGKDIVTESRPRTNGDGVIRFTPKAGAEYLLSSVVLIDNTSPFYMKDSKAHWESYWASLTFKMPK